MSKIKLLAGLGNPGKQYQATRHNAGFWFIDRIIDRYHARLVRKDKFFGHVGSIDINGTSVHLLKPDTMMNLSGKSVQIDRGDLFLEFLALYPGTELKLHLARVGYISLDSYQ